LGCCRRWGHRSQTSCIQRRCPPRRTTNAPVFQWQFATTRDSRFNCDHLFCSSELPVVIPPTPTATNGQTSSTPIPPSLNELEESRSSSTPKPQQDSATPSAEAPPAGVSAVPPSMPRKPTQPRHAISIPNGYHIQINYAAAMSNGTPAFLPPNLQHNGLLVQTG
jgi:hypothetical protein